ncbi:MAG: NAD(P)-dependent glycerol-3-phosphate dehydrogenase [Alphaproteobacteria bacterium]|nr:NAD(P)-dependent glycerol-3-phosphate dehydrogenase [Alphaproteobacteria bacterium]
MKKIGIIGTGVFGTALALTATRAENQVLCWARNPEVINSINKQHQNPIYLPQISLPTSIAATSELAEIFSFSNTILLTVSAQATRSVMRQIKPFLKQDTILLLCAKGIEETTGQILSEIAATEIPTTNIAILSGPGFAIDIAQKRFASVTIACKNKEIAQQLTTTLGTPFFRPYMTTDIISPQIGGSVKNVIAIASGIAEGAAFGDGSRAALITRGFTEMARLSKALGGELQTIMGMCGMGDLVMTASCTQSRNFSFGKKIGLYGSAAQALTENTQTVEGIFTARAVVKRAQDLGIEMPICETVNRILYHGISLKEAINELLSRSYKSEGI